MPREILLGIPDFVVQLLILCDQGFQAVTDACVLQRSLAKAFPQDRISGQLQNAFCDALGILGRAEQPA